MKNQNTAGAPLATWKEIQPGPLLVHGLTVVDGMGGVMRDAALAIDGGRLLDVGPSVELTARHGTLQPVDGTGFTAMPGLVNAHTHAALGFFRGLGHGLENMIETFLFPAEKSLTAELLEPLCYSYFVAGLKSGVTCFGDHYYFIEGVAAALDRLGLRGVVGETVADLGGAFPGTDGWKRWQKSMERWSYSSRVRPLIAPHAADTVSPALLKELAAFAKKRGLPLHMHLAQTSGERQRVVAREGMSPVAYAERCGALGPRTLAVHLIAIDEADAGILARSGTTAGHCPASQIIYETLAPVAMLTRHGVPLALGTDCAASNDGADMMQEMKISALFLQDRGALPASRTPKAILQSAAINGARVLGYDAEIGSLEIGKAADVVFLESSVDVLPDDRPDVNVVYSMASRNVRHVMIEGRFALLDGRVTSMPEADLRVAYVAAVREIHRRIKA